MGLKGGRSIVVRDLTFCWKFCHPTTRILGDSPEGGDIIIHAKDGPGRLRAKVTSDVEIDDYSREQGLHRASVTPKDVRLVIEKALDDGWDTSRRRQHELEGPLKLADYSVAS